MMFEDVIRERTATRSFKDKKVEKGKKDSKKKKEKKENNK